MKASIECTPAQLVVVMIALQDYSRFSQSQLATKCASDLFFKVEEIRRENDKFFNATLQAMELLMKPVVLKGQK